MADKSRSINLNILLLICALVGGIIFFGCSTGTTGSAGAVRQIMGKVKLPADIITKLSKCIKARASVRGAAQNESIRELVQKIAENKKVFKIHTEGTVDNPNNTYEAYSVVVDKYDPSIVEFVISGVAAASYRVIANIDFQKLTNEDFQNFPNLDLNALKNFKSEIGTYTYKMQSETINADDSVNEIKTTTEVKIADTTTIIKAEKGGSILVWGERVYDSDDGAEDGCYTTPPMPKEVTASIYVIHPQAQQYNTTELKVKFGAAPAIYEVSFVEKGSNVVPPTAKIIKGLNKAEPGETIEFEGEYTKDEKCNNIEVHWKAKTDLLVDTGIPDTKNSENTWRYTCPNENCTATVTYTVTDVTNGLTAKAYVEIKVGAGPKDNTNQNKPVINDITFRQKGVVSDVLRTKLQSYEAYTVKVDATDADKGATLTYTFSCEPSDIGKIEQNNGATATFTAGVTHDNPLVGTITVVVSDKGGKHTASRSWGVKVIQSEHESGNTPPYNIKIITPKDRAIEPNASLFKAKEKITFEAEAKDDYKQDQLKYLWEYAEKKEDGSAPKYKKLGEGKKLEYDKQLKPATYTIRLTVTDIYNMASDTSILIRINEKPKAEIITDPKNTTQFVINEQVTFAASATDIETPEKLTYKWQLYLVKEDGSSATVEIKPAGDAAKKSFTHKFTDSTKEGQTYKVMLEVKDEVSTGTDGNLLTVGETVTAPEKSFQITNKGPVMSITGVKKTDDSSVNTWPNYLVASTTYTFKGKGKDFRNNQILEMEFSVATTATGLVYRKTGDDTFIFDTVGTFTVYLTATDSDNISSYTKQDFLVCATPTVKIASPSSGPFVRCDNVFKYIKVEVTPSPQSDNDFKLEWFNDDKSIDDKFTPMPQPKSSGNKITYTYPSVTLASGPYKLCCKVTSNKSQLATEAYVLSTTPGFTDLSFIVNALPVATITVDTTANTQYATGPGNIAIYLAGHNESSLEFTFNATATDPEPKPEERNIVGYSWLRNGAELATTASYTDHAKIGESKIELAAYDGLSEVGKFKDYASGTASLTVRIWQSRSFKKLAASGTLVFELRKAKDLYLVDSENEKLTFGVLADSYLEQNVWNYPDDQYTSDYLGTPNDPKIPNEAPNVVGGKFLAYSPLIKARDALLLFDANASQNILAVEATSTFMPHVNPERLKEIGSASYMAADEYSIFLCVATNTTKPNRLVRLNYHDVDQDPVVKEQCNDTTFANLTKIRLLDDSNSKQPCVVDKDNQMVFRYSDTNLSRPLKTLKITDSAYPLDVASNGTYYFVLRSDYQIEIFDTNANSLMKFGRKATDLDDKCGLYEPKAIFAKDGELFILEADGTADGTKGRLHIIRSGLTNFLDNK